jgi:hypothetical protein
MRNQDVPEREQLGDCITEPVEGRGAGVGLVTTLNPGPLLS